MAISITTSDQASASHGIKALVAGLSGVGKTVLCSTAPQPIIISAEKGLLSIAERKVPVIEVKTIAEIYEVYSFLTQSRESVNYWTVCIDSLTEIAEVVLSHLLKTKGQNDPRKAYGELIPEMSSLIRAFRDLSGKHVLFTSKLEQVKDEATGMLLFGPAMPGQKLGPQIPYFFDEVFALRIGKTADGKLYRYVQTGPDLQYQAKDRSGYLEFMEPPDLTHIFNKIIYKGGPQRGG